MKHHSLTTALRDGDLRPKERVLLMVQSDVAKERTGTAILSDTDKHAIGESWRPANNEEVREYNKYNEGWRITGGAEIDAQTTFLNAQSAHLRKQPFVFNLLQYPQHRQMLSMLDRLCKLKSVSVEEAATIAEKQKTAKLNNGLDFDYALYKLAFERLTDEDKKRFNELYPDIETDHQYLDQEEIIANLLSKDGALSAKNKEKLAALVAEKSYNAFAKEYQLFHYFACIPLAEVARQFLVTKEVNISGKPLAQNQEADDEDDITHRDIQRAMETYSTEHHVTIEAMLKEACCTWLEGDLFEQYTPLVLSNDCELFDRWLATKAKAGTILEKHIKKGELKIRNRSLDESRLDQLYSKRLYDGELEKTEQAMEVMDLELNPEAHVKGELDEKTAFALFSKKILTGESLYAFTGSYEFVTNFKKDVDTYNANLGLVYDDDDSEHTGRHLDQELLIADKNNAGELNIFSAYGMATGTLKIFLESQIYFKETGSKSGIMLEFKDPRMEEAFMRMKEDLVEGYATLLSFVEIYSRLSKIYDVDLMYQVKKWLDVLGDYIDQHNEALRIAAGQTEDEDRMFRKHRPVLEIDEAFFIDREKIEPDRGKVMVYFEKLGELFGNEFGSYEKPDEEMEG